MTSEMSSDGFARIIWCDSAGIRRCRAIPRRRLENILGNGVGLAECCMFLPCYGDSPPANPATGGPSSEVRLIPDMSTCVDIPWNNSVDCLVLANLKTEEGEPAGCCPRNALASALKFLQTEATEGPLQLDIGFEVEFNLLKKSTTDSTTGVPLPIDASVYCQTSAFNAASHVLRDMCSNLDVLGDEIEQVHGESGHGQFEIVTKYMEAKKAADMLIYRKEAISGVAEQHNMIASFLPKLFLDQAGNGCHCHFSLKDTLGTHGMGNADLPYSLSEMGESFAAGVLKHMPALLSFTAGNCNSYRRIAPGTWSGSFQCWGVGNKEATLRLVGLPGQPDSINFEYKAMDSTANPHLALAAIIVAGTIGLRDRIKLPSPIQGDPGLMTDEERQEAGCFRLPCSLSQALDCLEQDEEFWHAFDEAVGNSNLREAYIATKRAEAAFFENKTFEEEVAMLHARF